MKLRHTAAMIASIGALVLLLGSSFPAHARFPYALSVSSAEMERGKSYELVATVQDGDTVNIRLPEGIYSEFQVRQYQTVQWKLTVQPWAAMSRIPTHIDLMIDGTTVTSATVRIWTEEVVKLPPVNYLPMITSVVTP